MSLPKLSSSQQTDSIRPSGNLPPSSTSGLHRSAMGSMPPLNDAVAESFHPPVLLGRDDGVLRAQWLNLYVMRWYGPSTTDRLEIVFGDMRRMVAQHGQICAVSVLELGTTPPGEDGRKLVTHHQLELAGKLASVAYIVEGQGFMASTLMSVLVSIQQLRKRLMQAEKVFRHTDAASYWIHGHMGSELTPAQISDAIANIRQM